VRSPKDVLEFLHQIIIWNHPQKIQIEQPYAKHEYLSKLHVKHLVKKPSLGWNKYHDFGIFQYSHHKVDQQIPKLLNVPLQVYPLQYQSGYDPR